MAYSVWIWTPKGKDIGSLGAEEHDFNSSPMNQYNRP